MKRYLAGILVAGSIVGSIATASAAVIPSCTTYTGANGTTTFPGTYVSTVGSGVGQVCQIGNIATNNVSSTGTFVNNSQPTSIYSFYWGGGQLTIAEKLGNNGLGDAVDVNLDLLMGIQSTSPQSTIASIVIPFTSGPSVSYTVIDNFSLAAGYYAIGNMLAQNAEDPTFQINFSAPVAVPEPNTLALLLASLVSLTILTMFRRRQSSGH